MNGGARSIAGTGFAHCRVIDTLDLLHRKIPIPHLLYLQIGKVRGDSFTDRKLPIKESGISLPM